MNVGMDLGYFGSKVVCQGRRIWFPSVVGSPDRPSFSLTGEQGMLLRKPMAALVGYEAIEQSRFLHRREDRSWVTSPEWYALFCAALSEISDAPQVDVTIVAGLPSLYYLEDKPKVQKRMEGEHEIQREARPAQRFRVTVSRIIPQPFGTVLSVCLSDSGKSANNALAQGQVGVIDCGGKTTGVLTVMGLREVARETTSVNLGAWDVVRRVREWLSRNCPELELRDHEIAAAIEAREVRYFGDLIPIGQVVDSVAGEMAEAVISQASQLWNGGAKLDAILVSGGGAHLLGPYICKQWRHARIVEEPMFANALGFWRFAERLASKQQ